MKTLMMEVPFYPGSQSCSDLSFFRFTPDLKMLGIDTDLFDYKVDFNAFNLAMAVHWTHYIQSVIAQRFQKVRIYFREYRKPDCYGDGESVFAEIQSENSEFNWMVNSRYDLTNILIECEPHILSNGVSYCWAKIDPYSFLRFNQKN